MKKNVKGFTVEDWVIGENTDSCFRIQVTSVIEPIGQNVNTLAEATAKIKYLDQQYFHVIERNKALEEQLYNSQCQIRALQASNVYISEEILEETVEKELQIITEEIIQKHSDDTENKQALTKQIYFQKLIIDELMCKIQNMHHRIEYYKDDVTDLKTQCEKEKVTIEVEKKDKKVVREQYEKALQTIEKLNEDIEKQNIQIQEIYNNREVQTKLVIEKTDYQVDAELYLNEFKAKDQLGRVARLYNEKLQEVQLKNQIIVETLGLCMKKKIDELRNFYEYRIAQMVKEYSFEEGKFYSIILRLKSEISEHMQNVHSLDQTAKMVTSRFTLDRQRSLKAESTIKNLNDLLDKISFKAIESSSHDKAEIESIMKHSEEVEEDIKNQYKLQQRIAEKEHMEAMNILTHSYTLKINKINDEFKFWEKKIQEKGQSQHNVLLQEISRLETEKTEIEMQTAARVQAVVREANSVNFI